MHVSAWVYELVDGPLRLPAKIPVHFIISAGYCAGTNHLMFQKKLTKSAALYNHNNAISFKLCDNKELGSISDYRMLNFFEQESTWTGRCKNYLYITRGWMFSLISVNFFSIHVHVYHLPFYSIAPWCFSFSGVVHRGFPRNIWLIDHWQYTVTF